MKKIVFMSIALLLLVVMQVHALPILQLDADPGYYVGGTEESTVTNASNFKLTALLDPDGLVDIASGYSYSAYDFFISIALFPRTGENDGGDYGSFTFGSVTYDVTSGMFWGNPPLADIFANNNDLPSHGVFPTWYQEVSFGWGTSTIADGYDVQTGDVQTGNLLRYVDFGVNVTDLAVGYGLHFDLYGYLRPATDATIDPASLINAPFSHDVTSWPDGGIPPQAIPEPSTIFLLGIGLLVAGGLRRKKKE